MISVSFLGDISLNDNYTYLYRKGLNPFKNVQPLLNSNDLVIGNLECFLSGSAGENTFKIQRLHTGIDTINYIKNINLSLACLANNHVYDNLDDGFLKTINFLESNKIAYIGASTFDNENAPYIYTKNDITIGILNYVTEDTNPCLHASARVRLNFLEVKRVSHDIEALKLIADHIVIFIHWGGSMEGSMYPDIYQPRLAHILIDAGADLIVGHHSHTLQPYEIYHGKHIFYSLGNFCFSDVIFEGKRLELDKRRVNHSIILSVNFDKTNYSVQMHGIINRNDFIEPCNQLVYKKIKQISFPSYYLYKFPFWHFFYFYEKKIYPIEAYFFANNRNPIKQLSKLTMVSFFKHLGRFFNPNLINNNSTHNT